jgi:hypothetical protein
LDNDNLDLKQTITKERIFTAIFLLSTNEKFEITLKCYS